MVTPETPPIFRNTAETQKKQLLFDHLSSASLHLVLDFDRTLTVARPDTDDNVTAWNILN